MGLEHRVELGELRIGLEHAAQRLRLASDSDGRILLLALLFFVAAVLYGMVGHAGASAYLAIMALVGVSPEVMRPTALVLNILVASIVTLRFARAGYVRPMLRVPFLWLHPRRLHRWRDPVAARAVSPAGRSGADRRRIQVRGDGGRPGEEFPPRAPALLAVISGAVIGLLAGLTGTGGGIFLTPLLLAAGWAGTRFAAGTSAIFILANSVSGSAGNYSSVGNIP